MRYASTLIALLLGLATSGCAAPRSKAPDYGRPLPVGAAALLPLQPGEQAPDLRSTWLAREEVLPALDRSIGWMNAASSKRHFPMAGIGHDRAKRSLVRFRELLMETAGPGVFDRAIRDEFQWFKSAGWDGKGGGVLFTGYCTPILEGSAVPNADYRHPLFGLPEDLAKGPDGTILGRRLPGGVLEEYPTRRAIEASGMLNGRGLELVWLESPLDAYIAHVNGSAFVELRDGSMARFGYAGKNGRPYSSLGSALIEDGVMKSSEMSLTGLRRWARENPEQVEEYLHRNDSYVFFTPIEGNPRGSLNLEVEPTRTLATDKTLFPRASLVFVSASLPDTTGRSRPFRQLMLDQDTGGAIRTAGRADIYVGIGPEAERRAGATKSEGQLYYLFTRE